MKKLTNFMLATACSAALVLGFAPQTAEAQLVVVEEKFRIVDVDQFEKRIAIAKPDANPDVRQNWVYVDSETRGSVRNYTPNGYFRDRQLSPQQILRTAESHEGELIKVHGGRDWDGSIDAKTVWF